MTVDVDAVRAAAGSTRDPEIRRSLAEMGLLDEVQIVGSEVVVHFHLTSPLCPSSCAGVTAGDGKEFCGL
jgi:metal-sulfur cluster biosynthetic enzyme